VRRRIRSMEMTLAVVFLARCAAGHHVLQKGRLSWSGIPVHEDYHFNKRRVGVAGSASWSHPSQHR
jgi:hypothetical protein